MSTEVYKECSNCKHYKPDSYNHNVCGLYSAECVNTVLKGQHTKPWFKHKDESNDNIVFRNIRTISMLPKVEPEGDDIISYEIDGMWYPICPKCGNECYSEKLYGYCKCNNCKIIIDLTTFR
jgi:hypothetical protein